MSSLLSSLGKWPPQPSTVVGLAAVAGLVAHVTTGNPVWDAAAAAVVAILLPDNSTAIGEVRTLIAAALDIVAKTRPMIVAVLLLGAGLGLSSCQNAQNTGTAATTTGGAAGWQQALGQFTVADLQAAQTDAKAHGDAVAATCYTALVPVVQNLAGADPAAGLHGAFTVFQAARDLANGGQSTTLQGLNVACAPLVLDAQATALALAARIGIAVAPLPVP